MKKKYIFALLILLGLQGFVNAQTPNWQWAKTTGEQYTSNFAKDITNDAAGNTYMTGFFFAPTLDFGGTVLNRIGISGSNVFVAKYNASGGIVWAHNYGSTGYDEAWGIAADAVGNIYVTGIFTGTSITFGSITLTNHSANKDGVFLVKLDAAGNVLWAKKGIGASVDKEANDVAIDGAGNITIVGYSSYGTFSFDNTVLDNATNSNQYIIKFDPDGNVLWSSKQTSQTQNRADGVASDAAGNTYVTGYHIGSGILGLPASQNPNPFLAKYDTQGTLLWAVAPAATSGNTYSFDVHAGTNGKVIITGSFEGATFTVGTTILTNGGPAGNPDIFVAQYDASGNFEWAKSGSGDKYDRGYKVTSDAQGNVYLSGYFASQTINFGGIALTKANNYLEVSFITKYSVTGNEIWAMKVDKTTTGSTSPNGGLSSDAAGNVYLAGSANDDVAFGNTVLEDGGIFLAKLGSGTAGLQSTDANVIKLYPNPAKDFITVESVAGTISSLTIYNTLGQQVHSENLHNIQGNTTVDISKLQAGYYLVEVGSGSEKSVFKVLKN